MVLGGSAAVFAGLIWLMQDLFKDYQKNEIASLRNKIAALQGSDPPTNKLYGYFRLLQNRQFPAAYALVSEARKKERKEQFAPQDDFENFKISFEHTFGFDNVVVASIGDKKYAVSYDVIDNVPRNELYEKWRQQLFSSSAGDEYLNKDVVRKLILANLKEYYIFSDDDKTIDAIKSQIISRKIDDLFDPVFLDRLARDVRDRSKVDMKLKDPHPENVQVKRHFLHHIIMVQENDA
jgi:hypothetical protein